MTKLDPSIFSTRISRSQDVLRDAGVDALLLGPSADLTWLTGVEAHLSERLNLLVLPKDGEPVFIVPRLEAPLIAAAAANTRIVTWADQEDPTEVAAEAFNVRPGSTLAVGNQLWSAFLLRLQFRIKDVAWVEGTPLLTSSR
jgi:Xaa-Pro aminopeptidase